MGSRVETDYNMSKKLQIVEGCQATLIGLTESKGQDHSLADAKTGHVVEQSFLDCSKISSSDAHLLSVSLQIRIQEKDSSVSRHSYSADRIITPMTQDSRDSNFPNSPLMSDKEHKLMNREETTAYNVDNLDYNENSIAQGDLPDIVNNTIRNSPHQTMQPDHETSISKKPGVQDDSSPMTGVAIVDMQANQSSSISNEKLIDDTETMSSLEITTIDTGDNELFATHLASLKLSDGSSDQSNSDSGIGIGATVASSHMKIVEVETGPGSSSRSIGTEDILSSKDDVAISDADISSSYIQSPINSDSAPKLKSLLKKVVGISKSSSTKRDKRVKFNQTVMVFCEDLDMPPALNFSPFAFEPPSEYKDSLLQYEPPDNYRDCLDNSHSEEKSICEVRANEISRLDHCSGSKSNPSSDELIVGTTKDGSILDTSDITSEDGEDDFPIHYTDHLLPESRVSESDDDISTPKVYQDNPVKYQSETKFRETSNEFDDFERNRPQSPTASIPSNSDIISAKETCEVSPQILHPKKLDSENYAQARITKSKQDNAIPIERNQPTRNEKGETTPDMPNKNYQKDSVCLKGNDASREVNMNQFPNCLSCHNGATLSQAKQLESSKDQHHNIVSTQLLQPTNIPMGSVCQFSDGHVVGGQIVKITQSTIEPASKSHIVTSEIVSSNSVAIVGTPANKPVQVSSNNTQSMMPKSNNELSVTGHAESWRVAAHPISASELQSKGPIKASDHVGCPVCQSMQQENRTQDVRINCARQDLPPTRAPLTNRSSLQLSNPGTRIAVCSHPSHNNPNPTVTQGGSVIDPRSQQIIMIRSPNGPDQNSTLSLKPCCEVSARQLATQHHSHMIAPAVGLHQANYQNKPVVYLVRRSGVVRPGVGVQRASTPTNRLQQLDANPQTRSVSPVQTSGNAQNPWPQTSETKNTESQSIIIPANVLTQNEVYDLRQSNQLAFENHVQPGNSLANRRIIIKPVVCTDANCRLASSIHANISTNNIGRTNIEPSLDHRYLARPVRWNEQEIRMSGPSNHSAPRIPTMPTGRPQAYHVLPSSVANDRNTHRVYCVQHPLGGQSMASGQGSSQRNFPNANEVRRRDGLNAIPLHAQDRPMSISSLASAVNSQRDSRVQQYHDEEDDELENFVLQDQQRLERIKKRYFGMHLEDNDDPTFGFSKRPSVKGISRSNDSQSNVRSASNRKKQS